MGGIMMTEKFVAMVIFKDQFHFEISEPFNTHAEALAFIEGCQSNEAFDYGVVEVRYVTGEAQGPNDANEGEEA